MFKQKLGIDLSKIYSPVANKNSIRVVRAMCVAYNYVMEHLDADPAFLISGMVDLVYMEVPSGVKNATGTLYKLSKAIYGLKQTGSV
uniref:Reverse transcriptase Ty1/copia-type domain-containing protein n=1 Tax=Peronospora matthiolae TaxID=2874970 RepID=A0AAV1UTU1_9STRA